MTEDNKIKLSDFGQSNVLTDDINNGYELTKFVTTLNYRAPELYPLSYAENYSSKVDMWSLGVILAFLLNKHEIKGIRNESDYLKWMIQLLGLPNKRVQGLIWNK